MKRFHFADWSAPVVLLATSILAFGLLIPRLGFYWDDWPPQLVRQVYGVGSFWSYYSFDRPFSAWTHIALAPILGGNPVKWHILTLLIRCFTSIEVWWLVRGLFPAKKALALWTALIFLIYPVFVNQSLSVTFSQHWITYALFMASLVLMVQSIRRPALFIPLTILALSCQAVAHLTMEYFVGIELLRPLMLWIIVSEGYPETRQRIIRTFLRYIPYLLVMLVYGAYRLFFFRLSDQDPNSPAFFFQFFHQPLQVINILKYNILQDLTQLLITSWANTIQPSLFSFSAFTSLPWIVSIISAAGLSVYLYRFGMVVFDPSEKKTSWLLPALLIAISGIILGPLPAWMINRQVIDSVHSDRFALPALLGASLLLSLVIETFIRGRFRQSVLIAVLASLSISMNIRTAQDFSTRWENQRQFYWQLSWRAPAIKSPTAIISEQELFPDEGLFATSSALNVLYPQQNKPERLSYWMYGLRPGLENKIQALVNKPFFQTNFRIFSFKAEGPSSLLVYFNPHISSCLWVLRPDDQGDPNLSSTLQQALPLSRIERITDSKNTPGFPSEETFGKAPDNEWCYLYQKAELARQEEDWPAVVTLGNEARQKGYSPDNSPSNHPHEWIPFIEGYAYSGNWPQAIKMTETSFKLDDRYSTRFCRLWDKLKPAYPISENPSRVDDLTELLKCQP